MTRAVGRRVVKTPCCGILLTTENYASINYSADEYWTDGRAVGSLAPQDGGLRRCLCGGYFLVRQTKFILTLPDRKRRAPADWETTEVPGLVPGANSRDVMMRSFDTRPAAVIDAEEALIPPAALDVEDSDLRDSIESGTLDDDTMLIARRRYWRHLNDPYRDEYREYRNTHDDGLPDHYRPSAQQRDNMQKLVKLCEARTSPDWMELAELYHELEVPATVLQCIARARNRKEEITHGEQVVAKILETLVQTNIKGPVRYRV